MIYRIIIILSFLSLSLCSFSQIDSGYVDIKNGVLFYRIWGEGEPLVFLNGGPGLASQGYENYAIETSKYRKVILFDQRGTGKTKFKRRPSKIYISEMTNDLERLRKHLGFEKWDIFGHSFGGMYAQYYMARYPNSINKVILSASPSETLKSKYSFQKFKEVKQENKTELEKIVDSLYLEAKNLDLHPDSLKKINLATIARYYVTKPQNYSKVTLWFLNKCSPRYIGSLQYNVSQRRLTKKLKTFINPVLIIHGIADFINISHPLHSHELFSNSQLKIIEDSGHIMSIDSPEEYFGAIKEFLTDTK